MPEFKLIEIFGGLAPYCLWAIAQEATRAGRQCRSKPPVSRQGSKVGFVPLVMKAWGLTDVRWASIWLNDLDPVCCLFHELYSSNVLQLEVARRIWAMIPCPECRQDSAAEALRGLLRPTPDLLKGQAGCALCAGSGVHTDRLLWEAIRKQPLPEGRADLIAEVLFMQSRSFSLTPVSLKQKAWKTNGFKPELCKPLGDMVPRWALAERVEQMPDTGVGLVHTQQDAGLCLPSGRAEQTLVILDPPYVGTRGYAHDSSRETVLSLARVWSDAGALVLIHEAEGLSSRLGAGWEEAPSAPLRSGTSRLWPSGKPREWITFNRPPVWWPGQQSDLFGEKHA